MLYSALDNKLTKHVMEDAVRNILAKRRRTGRRTAFAIEYIQYRKQSKNIGVFKDIVQPKIEGCLEGYHSNRFDFLHHR
jgi:hypothetical protein